jgi:hypothetical protein
MELTSQCCLFSVHGGYRRDKGIIILISSLRDELTMKNLIWNRIEVRSLLASEWPRLDE